MNKKKGLAKADNLFKDFSLGLSAIFFYLNEKVRAAILEVTLGTGMTFIDPGTLIITE